MTAKQAEAKIDIVDRELVRLHLEFTRAPQPEQAAITRLIDIHLDQRNILSDIIELNHERERRIMEELTANLT